ncbi:hypothetical protein, partial [Eikenella sp. HMSC071B05]|uniref:hypothetical protein n=1 Tax=Eikenella sp. HMSC071B05 TaxID=1739300 RepID=UPI001AEF38CC
KGYLKVSGSLSQPLKQNGLIKYTFIERMQDLLAANRVLISPCPAPPVLCICSRNTSALRLSASPASRSSQEVPPNFYPFHGISNI